MKYLGNPRTQYQVEKGRQVYPRREDVHGRGLFSACELNETQPRTKGPAAQKFCVYADEPTPGKLAAKGGQISRIGDERWRPRPSEERQWIYGHVLCIAKSPQ